MNESQRILALLQRLEWVALDEDMGQMCPECWAYQNYPATGKPRQVHEEKCELFELMEILKAREISADGLPVDEEAVN